MNEPKPDAAQIALDLFADQQPRSMGDVQHNGCNACCNNCPSKATVSGMKSTNSQAQQGTCHDKR